VFWSPLDLKNCIPRSEGHPQSDLTTVGALSRCDILVGGQYLVGVFTQLRRSIYERRIRPLQHIEGFLGFEINLGPLNCRGWNPGSVDPRTVMGRR
jgi:hypothetical protein